MANMNLKVTMTGSPQQVSAALPQPSGSKGDVVGQPPVGNIYAQQMIFQNQGTHQMNIGDATTTSSNGLQLGASGSANFGAFINYGSYLSDWWVVGTAGDVLFVLYIQ